MIIDIICTNVQPKVFLIFINIHWACVDQKYTSKRDLFLDGFESTAFPNHDFGLLHVQTTDNLMVFQHE